MFYKSLLIVTFGLLVNHSFLFAQEEEQTEEVQTVEAEQEIIEDVSFVELTFDYLMTTSSFKNNIEKDLYGFTFSYLNQIKSKSYSFFGLQLSRYGLGGRSGTVADRGFTFTDDTQTVYYTLHLLYRYYLPFYYKTVEPYLELGAGPQTIYTRTSTTFLDEGSTSELSFEETSWGFSYGLSVGFTVKFYEQFFAIIKAGYFSSNANTYLVHREELDFVLPADNFDLRNSQLSYFKFQLGAAYSF